MRNVSGQFHYVCQLASTLFSLIVEAGCYLGLCLRQAKLWQRKISFCGNNWHCIKSIRSSRGGRLTPLDWPWFGSASGLIGDAL